MVKWKGFAEPTWEERAELEDVEAMDQFEVKYGLGDNVGEDDSARQGGPQLKRVNRRKRGGEL